MTRWFVRGLLALLLGVALLAAVALAYRAWRQHENAIAFAITTPNGIEEARYIRLGGVEQWIQIRGDDRANPVLLFIHGGPGNAESPMSALLRPWEKYFTVVMWDQRDAGKTFVRDGADKKMSLARVVEDGIELSEYLRTHLRARKIAVLGHSWGTMVGVHMVHDRPDLFSCYVGTGQVVSIAEKEPVIYARTLARLKAAHDEEGIRALEAAGAPPYRSINELMVERTWSARHDIPSERDLLRRMLPVGLFSPEISLWDIYEYFQAPKAAEAATFDEQRSYDARKLGTTFQVPFVIINGAQDQITPTDLARTYFDAIQAPEKHFVVIEGAGHSAVLTEPDAFLRVLLAVVRPIAIRE